MHYNIDLRPCHRGGILSRGCNFYRLPYHSDVSFVLRICLDITILNRSFSSTATKLSALSVPIRDRGQNPFIDIDSTVARGP